LRQLLVVQGIWSGRLPARCRLAGAGPAGIQQRRKKNMANHGNDRAPVAERTWERDQALSDELSIAHIESELSRQSKAIRRTQQGFVVFAVAALLIAVANLVVVSFKLGTKDVRVAGVPAKAAAAPGAAGAAAAPNAQAPAAAPHDVGISLKEFKVLPNSTTASSGKVTFNVRNAGTVKHEFVVIKTNKPAGALLKNGRADETGNIGEIPGLQPGQSKTLSLKMKPGHYVLLCNMPGHYMAGQHVDFTVK
jgi:uncharacterized cupredoxin-like copper-binding protein